MASHSAYYVFDGSTSPTLWDNQKFGTSILGDNVPSTWTVGNEFNPNRGLLALSQSNGYAIRVESNNFAQLASVRTGGASPMSDAVMLHEVLHKWLGDEKLADALGVTISPTNTDPITMRLLLTASFPHNET